MADDKDNKDKPQKNQYGGYGSCGYFATQSKETLSQYGKIGGKKSGETKRRKKEMKELLNILLDMPLKKGKTSSVESVKTFSDLSGKNLTTRELMLIKQVQKAMHGDKNAMEFIRDTIGEKPLNKVELGGELNTDVNINIIGDNEYQEDDKDD